MIGIGSRAFGLLVIATLVGVGVSQAWDEPAKAGSAFGAAGGCGPVRSGEGVTPELLIASDFPLQGSSRVQTTQIVAAIGEVLERRQWRAGAFAIGYQSCDDSTRSAGRWDAGQCSANANTYAARSELVGLIGTFNSGCAAIVIPVVNEATGGPIPMISPANTYPCLTEAIAGGCDRTEPKRYYPTGVRNYFRVTEHDTYQALALAKLMRSEARRSIFIVNDSEAYGLGVAVGLRRAVRQLGMSVAGFSAWNPRASSYEALMHKVADSGADTLVLAGLIDENGAQVIQDKVTVLGPNTGPVRLYASDGFTTRFTIDETGPASYGMVVTVDGVPLSSFPPKGRSYARQLAPRVGGDVDPYAVYAAQVTEVLLEAIARSDGTRQSVLREIRRTDIRNGYIGRVRFRRNGDPVYSSGFTAYRLTARGLVTHRIIRPTANEVLRMTGP